MIKKIPENPVSFFVQKNIFYERKASKNCKNKAGIDLFSDGKPKRQIGFPACAPQEKFAELGDHW